MSPPLLRTVLGQPSWSFESSHVTAHLTKLGGHLAPVAFRVRTYGLDVGTAGQAWVDHILAHPSMLQWEAEALSESWREAGHEAELRAAGQVIADYRTG